MSVLGDIPTWITTIAVGFGAIQLYQDRQERMKQADSDARQQARGLSAWAGSSRDKNDNDKVDRLGYVIYNDSGLPFRNVEVDVLLSGERQIVSKALVLPPGRFFVPLHVTKRTRDGKRLWDFAQSLEEFERPIRPYTTTKDYGVIELRFTDAAGRGWRVLRDGRLVDLTTRTAPAN